MAVGFYHANYWHANYWHANYWAPTGSIAGEYWHVNYFHANYWHGDYWAASGDPGDVHQTNAPNISITPFVTVAGVSLNVLANTPVVPITTFTADANLDIDPPITTPNVPIVGFSTTAGQQVIGSQAGDIDLLYIPESTITVTFGVIGTTPGIPIQEMSHTIEEGGGVTVGASIAAVPIASFVTDARLDIAVEPLPKNVPVNGFNTTAGIGTQVPATLPGVIVTGATHTIVATPIIPGDVFASFATVPLSGINPTVVASDLPDDVVLDQTVANLIISLQSKSLSIS